MPAINVENAVIKTASVEIKTLTISGRQVTLSVFRQIQEEDIFDQNMSLKGIPWGTVNYFWKEDDTERKIHLLWQLGKQLRRCILEKKSTFKYEHGENEHLIGRFAGIKRTINHMSSMVITAKKNKNSLSTYREEEKENIMYLELHIKHLKERLQGSEWNRPKDGEIEKYTEMLTALKEDVSNAEKEIPILELSLIELTSKYNSFLEGFLELPHLFIAV